MLTNRLSRRKKVQHKDGKNTYYDYVIVQIMVMEKVQQIARGGGGGGGVMVRARLR
jgi:hypothetical protein